MSSIRIVSSIACVLALSVTLVPALSAQVPSPQIVLSQASVTVTEGGATASYTVGLSTPSPTQVVIAITGVGSDVTVSPSSLTFAPGPSSAQTVVVTPTNDAATEGSESLTLLHTASSTDPNYQGKTASLAVSVTDNDRGLVVRHAGTDATATSVSEAGGQDTIRVALGAAPTSSVTVKLTPDPQLSLSLLTVTFTTGNWQTARDITIAAANDQIAQGTRSRLVSASATSGDAGYHGQGATLSATIVDNDVAGYVFNALAPNTLPTLAFSEGGEATYTVKLTSQPTAPVTINLGGTNGATTVPASLTFSASTWGTAQTVRVQRPQDLIDQSTGTTYGVTVTMATSTTDAGYATIPSPVTATVADDDEANLILTATGGSTSVQEGDPVGDTFGVRLATQPIAPVTVALSAPAGITMTPASLTFDGTTWGTAQNVAVVAVDDGTAELPGSVTVTATAASSDVVHHGKAATLSVSIVDNDGVLIIAETAGSTAPSETTADTFTVRLIGNPTAPVNVRLTASDATQFLVNGAAQADLVFDPTTNGPLPASCSTNTPPQRDPCPWNVAQTVTVTAVADRKVDGPRTGQITLKATSGDATYNNKESRPVAVTAVDTDVAGFVFDGAAVGVLPALAVTEAQSTTYTIKLNSIPTGTVTLGLTGTGAATATPASLTFAPGAWNVAQTVTVAVARDNVDQGTTYSASVVQQVTTTADPMYASIPGPVAVTVNDHADDIAGWLFSAAGQTSLARDALPSLALNEGASGTYTVRPYSKPVADVVVSVTGSGGSAATPATLTFTAATWATPQTVTVNVAQDSVDRGNTYSAPVVQSVASSDPRYAAIPGPVAVTVTDDDVAAVRMLPTGASSTVVENGTAGTDADTVEVFLATQPTGPVTVALSAGSEVTLSVTSLQFTASDWDEPQTVTVTAVDDEQPEFTETATVTALAASPDALYSGKDGSIAITVLDDDGVLLLQPTGTDTAVQEGGTSDSYTVRLIANPNSQVRVTVSSPGGQLRFNGAATTELTFERGSTTPVPARCAADPTANCSWDNPQTVTVTGFDDALVEGTAAAIIQHAVSSSDARFNGVATPSLPATVFDDDAGLLLVETDGGTSVVEGETTDTYTVHLSTPPTFSVAIPLEPGEGLQATPSTLFFDSESWSEPQTVTVSAADDRSATGPRTGTIGHPAASADDAYNGLSATVTVSVADDDAAGLWFGQDDGATTVTEGGAGDSYAVKLSSEPAPGATVTVQIAQVGSQLNVGKTSLAFTSSNWNTAQWVTVFAVNDAASEGAHAATIRHTMTSSDLAYHGLVQDLVVAIVDND